MIGSKFKAILLNWCKDYSALWHCKNCNLTAESPQISTKRPRCLLEKVERNSGEYSLFILLTCLWRQRTPGSAGWMMTLPWKILLSSQRSAIIGELRSGLHTGILKEGRYKFRWGHYDLSGPNRKFWWFLFHGKDRREPIDMIIDVNDRLSTRETKKKTLVCNSWPEVEFKFNFLYFQQQKKCIISITPAHFIVNKSIIQQEFDIKRNLKWGMEALYRSMILEIPCQLLKSSKSNNKTTKKQNKDFLDLTDIGSPIPIFCCIMRYIIVISGLGPEPWALCQGASFEYL